MRDALIGAWNLRTPEEEVYPDGRVTYPFGTSRQARIIYSPDGNVTAISTPGERRLITTMQSPWNYEGASAAEIAELLSDCVAYSGQFEVVGTAVHHRIDTALNPILIGQTLTREIALIGDTLTLTGPANDRGTFLRIHWQR